MFYVCLLLGNVITKCNVVAFSFFQSYGLRNKGSRELDLLTYVDYVAIGGPAHQAGMRQGTQLILHSHALCLCVSPTDSLYHSFTHSLTHIQGAIPRL